jgi:DNA-binding response OmpR family regulator
MGDPVPPEEALAKTVLIVEDEQEIRELLAHYLRKYAFRPLVAADGEAGLAAARAERPDMILLDIMLPKIDGLELLKIVRADPAIARTPLLMLTAKGDETDRVVGLELGADDYIPKPFSPREVVARIKAIFRRIAPPPPPAGDAVHEYRGIRMDLGRHEVRVDGTPVALTTKEFRILEALLCASGRVLSREMILQKVWGDDTYVTDRTVDVHVAKLRQKIPLLAKAIETVKDVGYKLSDG